MKKPSIMPVAGELSLPFACGVTHDPDGFIEITLEAPNAGKVRFHRSCAEDFARCVLRVAGKDAGLSKRG